MSSKRYFVNALDGSKVIRTYGPFESLDAADAFTRDAPKGLPSYWRLNIFAEVDVDADSTPGTFPEMLVPTDGLDLPSALVPLNSRGVPMVPEMRHRRRPEGVIRSLFRAMRATLDLHAAEQRTGIMQVEAAAVEEWRRDLASVTSSPEERQKARDMVIMVMQLGVSDPKELEQAVVFAKRTWARGVTDRDIDLIWKYKRS